MDQSQEASTVREVLSGNKEAFARIVHEHGPAVYSFVRRMIRDEELARDLSQEVFARAYVSLGSYDGSRPLSPWLRRIALNLVRDYLRGRDVREDRASELPENPRDHAAPDPESAWLERERESLLHLAMQGLPPEQSEAVALRFFQGMSFPGMAEFLDISQSAAKMRTYRALEALADLLGEE